MAATIGAARIELSINSAKFEAQMERARAAVGKFQTSLNNVQRKFQRFGSRMERAGQTLTRSLTVPIGLIGGAAVKSAIDFESAFAGVRKTVDATEGEFATLREGIINMSKELPTSAGEIAGVAEAAGQLGIKTDAIMEFSRTMVMLGDTTNLSAEQAATSLARIANVMQIPQDRFDEMGSTIVELGNNFATTEDEITRFAQRMSGAARIAGMSAADVFSIATAMSSVGVEAEAGGTAVQKVLINMNTAVTESNEMLTKFAKVAGMSATEFSAAWREDAGKAFASFVNGLGEAGDRAAGTLDDLGLADQRLVRSFLSLANAGDLVNRTLETGRSAWGANVALTKEAQQRYDTIAAKLDTLKNRIVALGISVGDALLPFVEDATEFIGKLTESFENLSAEAKVNVLKIAALLAGGGPLLIALGKLAQAVAATVKFIRGRFLLIVAAIGIVGTTIQWVADNWGISLDNMEMSLKKMKNAATTLFGPIGTAAAWVGEQIINLGKKVGSFVADKGSDLINFGKDSKAFTSWAESAENFKNNLVDLGNHAAQFAGDATGLNELLAQLEGGFDRAAESANNAMYSMRRFLQLQSQVDISQRGGGPTVSSSMSGVADVGGLGKMQRAVEKTKEMSHSLRLALGLVPGQVGAAKASMQSFSEELANNLVPMISGALGNAAGAFIEMSTAAAISGGSLKNVFMQVLSSLADLAIRVGKIAIATGIAIEGIKKALESLNPVAAIAAGAALIALGAGVKAALSNAAKSKGGDSGGSDIPGMAQGGIVPDGFPGDSYPAMLSSGERVIPKPLPLSSNQSNNGDGMVRAFEKALSKVQWVQRGSDLVAVIESAKSGALR